MRLLRGWRPALRIARREALRARGRSVLVLVMIGLPVLGIVALDTLGSHLRRVRRRGAEPAARRRRRRRVVVRRARRRSTRHRTCRRPGRAGDGETVADLPPPDAPRRCRRSSAPTPGCVERVTGRVAVRTDVGLARPTAVGLDLQDPMTRGLFDLRDGRYPRADGRGRRQRAAGRARLPGRLDPDPGRRQRAAGRRHRGVDDHPRPEPARRSGGRARARPGCRSRRGGGRLAGLAGRAASTGTPSGR